MKRFGSIALAALAMVALAFSAGRAQPTQPSQNPTQNGSTPRYLNPQMPIDERVNDLVSRMTLEEKASQLINPARAIRRLGVPAYDWWSEALHGVARAGIATVFPQSIGLAATFNIDLIHDMAVVISTEARVKHNIALRAGHSNIYEGLTFWSPNINIFRDPRWGRGQETYGEDPYLTAQMGMAFVRGMQGDDPHYLRTIATPKHYAVHSGPEPTRHSVDVKVSRHDEEDTYLPAFRAAVVEAKAGSVMCAYNRVNGQPACANDFLLMDTLRNAWNFQGYVVSDCDAIADIHRGHHFAASYAEAAALSLKDGVDNDCIEWPQTKGDASDYQHYVDAVKQGMVNEAVVDASVRRLFTARMKLGMFDPPEMVKYAQVPDSELDSIANRQLALQAARETMVLLKNNGVLPLKPGIRRIAVVGPLADQVTPLLGNYNGTPSRATTVLDGIRQVFPNAKVSFEPGTNFLREVVPVPVAVLSTNDGRPGLKTEFFDNRDFSGQPILSRNDPAVSYEHGMRSTPPAALPDVSEFAVRWTGKLTPESSGLYEIGLDAPGGRLWLDGKLVVDISAPRQRKAMTAVLTLQKGRSYAVKIESDLGPPLMFKFVWGRRETDPLARALTAVRNTDVTIAVVGITPQLEGEEMNVDVPGFVGGDRTSLDLPKDEEDLLRAVKATGKPLVVVLMNGSALAVNWANKHADAIVDAWYAGEEGGRAVAETLSGDNNPAGRLPVTFYTGVEQLPPFEDYAMRGRTYRYFTGKPLYPFGYGLSYTRFAYSGLKLSANRINAGDTLGVDVDVRNLGRRAGDEVVQLYIGFPHKPSAPIRVLRAFKRVHLNPGETQRLHFDLKPRDLSMVTKEGDVVVEAGTYPVNVGGGQPKTGAPFVAASFRIEGELKLPD